MDSLTITIYLHNRVLLPPRRRKKKCIRFLEDGSLNLNMTSGDAGDSDSEGVEEDCSTLSSTTSMLAPSPAYWSPSYSTSETPTPPVPPQNTTLTAVQHQPNTPALQHSVASMTSKDRGIDMTSATSVLAT